MLLRRPLHRAPSWAVAWLTFILLCASTATAFAQDDEPGDDAAEASDTDDAEGSDDDDGDGDGSDDDDGDEGDDDDDEEEEAAKPEPAEEPEPEPAEATEEPPSEDVAGDQATTKKNAVDVMGWRAGDLNNLLGNDEGYPRLDLGAYVRGGMTVNYRPDALPVDEIEYGFNGRAGLRIRGEAHEMWKARIWLEFRANSLGFVQGVQVFDSNNDGTGSALNISTSRTTLVQMEQAVGAFVPWDFLAFEVGIQRIPFTLQAQSKNTATLFPARSNANRVFLSGADVGAMVRGNFFDGIFLTSLGVWDGSSLGLGVPFSEPRGVVVSYRADVNPFGAFPFGEGDRERGPFRLGIGGGLIWRPTTIFDVRTGTEPRTVQDLRFAASLRMAWAGFFVATEYFRRQQTDDFSFRPQIADGAYAQLAYYFTIADALGLEPSARVGFVNDDQTFDPRLTGYVDAGLAFYPIVEDPSRVKVWLTYLGERRFTEGEEAHGGSTSVQITF